MFEELDDGTWTRATVSSAPELATEIDYTPAADAGYVLIDEKTMIHRDALSTYVPLVRKQLKDAQSQLAQTRRAVAVQLSQLLDASAFLPKWEQMGISRPTRKCRRAAIDLCLKILDAHQVLPSRISNSIEEGIFLNYRHTQVPADLSIEIYNTGEVAGLVNRNNSVVKCINVESMNDVDALFYAWR